MAWHVYQNHAKELKLRNIDDAIDFVLDIINNVDHVRLDYNNTYIFSVENGRSRMAHRAIAIVVNADSGEFMGIKTSGFDRMNNLEKRPILWEKGAVSTPEAVATPTVTTVKAQQGDKHVGSTEGQSKDSISEKRVSASSSDIETEPKGKRNGTATPQNEHSSDGKVNTLSSDKQMSDEKRSAQGFGNKGDGILLQWNVLQKKMSQAYVHAHPFTAADVRDLPVAINRPIAVFESRGHGDFNILVGIEKDGKNFVVSLRARRKPVRGGEIVVEDIVTLYPKEEKGVIHWINTGLGKVYDKEKALEWLRTCETHNRHSAVQELEDAAKVIKRFENPAIGGTEEMTRDAARREEPGLVDWINKGLGKVYDKEKGLDWLHSAKSNSQAITAQTLEDAAKVIKRFENPAITEEMARDVAKRGTPIAPWSWGEEKRLGKYEKNAEGKMRTAILSTGDVDVENRFNEYEERYKGYDEANRYANKVMKDYGMVRYAQERAGIQQEYDEASMKYFHQRVEYINRLVGRWLRSETPEEAAKWAKQIRQEKRDLVGEMDRRSLSRKRA